MRLPCFLWLTEQSKSKKACAIYEKTLITEDIITWVISDCIFYVQLKKYWSLCVISEWFKAHISGNIAIKHQYNSKRLFVWLILNYEQVLLCRDSKIWKSGPRTSNVFHLSFSAQLKAWPFLCYCYLYVSETKR